MCIRDREFTIATSNNVSFDHVDVGPISIDKDAGVNAGNKKITNVANGTAPVSYTHLDVYKRQVLARLTEKLVFLIWEFAVRFTTENFQT